MAGHPSVKKRQKEVSRKERQAEKHAKRDERRTKRNDPGTGGEGAAPEEFADGFTAAELEQLEAGTLKVTPPAPTDAKELASVEAHGRAQPSGDGRTS